MNWHDAKKFETLQAKYTAGIDDENEPFTESKLTFNLEGLLFRSHLTITGIHTHPTRPSTTIITRQRVWDWHDELSVSGYSPRMGLNGSWF